MCCCVGRGRKCRKGEFKELKIRFGQIVADEKGPGQPEEARRMGFGVENEVVTLQKGTKSGVVADLVK